LVVADPLPAVTAGIDAQQFGDRANGTRIAGHLNADVLADWLVPQGLAARPGAASN
jgi:hypothetical protein